MKLTITMKIMGGFTIVSLLFFLTSFVSWQSIETLNSATQRQSNVVIPTLKTTNQLVNTLSELSNLGHRSAQINDIDTLNKNHQLFTRLAENFQLQIKQLTAISINNNQTKKNLQRVENDNVKLFQHLDNMFKNKKLLLEQPNSVLLTLDDINTDIVASEALINDINQLLKQLVKQANNTSLKVSEEIKQLVKQSHINTIIVTVFAIILSLSISQITLKSIMRPLREVNKMLTIVASGDLSHKLDEKGNDELTTLSKNCNLLIESLRNLIQSISSRSMQLATAAEQTSAITAQSNTAILEQKSQLELAASATTEMSSTSQQVLSSANDALQEISNADEEAERVKQISNRNRQTIDTLANEVESASQVINQLQQDSASIGSILDVIRAIAEQTNLLALNAAIEAARAGEQGRGFAVVADEVRTLASRTQESTEEIQRMIEVLQSGAKQAVDVMDTGKKQTANCVEQSVQAEQALDTITEAVHKAYQRSSQIATAAEEQSVVSHEISENLESIVMIADGTTDGAKQTSQASSEVAQLAEELQHSILEFKL